MFTESAFPVPTSLAKENNFNDDDCHAKILEAANPNLMYPNMEYPKSSPLTYTARTLMVLEELEQTYGRKGRKKAD